MTYPDIKRCLRLISPLPLSYSHLKELTDGGNKLGCVNDSFSDS